VRLVGCNRRLRVKIEVMMNERGIESFLADHTNNDFALLSATRVREMLAAGEPLSEEFARPVVEAILTEHYQRS
jgi:ATP sulfurylase